MAFSKQHKNALVAQYVEWIQKSQGMVVLTYTKMTMKDIDTLRHKVRETGSEIHVVKNTLIKLAMDEIGMDQKEVFEGLTMVGFAFEDIPALAKVLSDATAKSEIFAVKGGFLGKQAISAAQFCACQQTGAHAGRTGPRPGRGGQGLLRKGSRPRRRIACTLRLPAPRGACAAKSL